MLQLNLEDKKFMGLEVVLLGSKWWGTTWLICRLWSMALAETSRNKFSGMLGS